MNKYPYLSDRNKAHYLSLGLMATSAFLGLLALFMKENKVLLSLSCIIAIVFFGFAMHYLDYHNVQGQSIKKYILTFHCFTIHTLLLMFSAFANAPGNLSYQVLHGLVDMMLVASLLSLTRIYKSDLSLSVIACAGLVTFILTLLNVNVVLALFIFCAVAVLIYFSYKKSIGSAAFGALIGIIILIPLINKNTPDVHRYLHILGYITMMVLAYLFYKDVEKQESLTPVTRSAPVEETKIENTDLPLLDSKTSTSKTKRSTRKTKTLKFDESWFIKSYQNKDCEDLLNAPLTAFKGVSKKMAEDMKEAFGIDTIGELAENKYFKWAKEIVEEAK